MEVLAACHLHSKWSYDGSWDIETLAVRFSRRGCRVLLMTEHDRGFSAWRLDEYRRTCARASSANILVVPGVEYSDANNCVHVLVWGSVPFLGEGRPTMEVLEAARAANGLAVLAHPSRRNAWKYFDPSWISLLSGIEVWNRKYDGWAPGRRARSLLHQAGVVPFVGLDFHTWRQSFPLTMTLELDSVISEEAVLGCLRSRRCHPRAFGISLTHKVLSCALPPLTFAEQGRQIAASILKRSGVFGR